MSDDAGRAVLSATGENALTIGVMGAVLFMGAVFAAQLWMRVRGAGGGQAGA